MPGRSVFGGAPAPAAGGPPARTAAVLWGALGLLVGVLVLVGGAVPWFEVLGESFTFTDDLASSWPLLAIGVLAVIGGVDGLRGSASGPAMAAGVGGILVIVHAILLRLLNVLSGYLELGPGAVLWSLAALVAVVLIVAAFVLAARDTSEGRAPGWIGAALVAGGVAWLVGVVVPDQPGVSVSDYLFGGDGWSDAFTVSLIGFTVIMILVAAIVRSRAAYGLVVGVMGFWTVAWVTTASGYRASSQGFVSYLGGSFAPYTIGTFVAAAAGCIGMLVVRRPAAAQASPARKPVVPLAPILGLVCLPIAAVFGLVQHAEHGDDDWRYDGNTAAATDEGLDDFGGDGVPPEQQPGGSVDVICTDLVDSSIGSTWQDVDGAIHVVIVVHNDCGTGQRLDDATALFTLTSNGYDVAAAEFDFARDPLDIPAYGSSDAELVFAPATFVDLEALETAGLGGDAGFSGSGSGSLGLTYSYVCTDAPDARASSASSPVTGEPTAAPIAPTVDGGEDALAQLAEISESDGPFVESSVLDQWVPQISSKRPDVALPDGSVWDAGSILGDHRSWRTAYPRVRLLWSGDYTTYTYPDFWVTIVAIPYATAEEANAWCDANGLPPEDCYAKLVSRTHLPEESTRHRG